MKVAKPKSIDKDNDKHKEQTRQYHERKETPEAT